MLRELVLVRTLAELADSLVDDFDVIDVLNTLTTRCVDVLDVAAAGVMLAGPDGALKVAASSSDTLRILELFELQADEGPCVDSYRSGTSVVNVELAAMDRRWPRFAPQALTAGFHSVHSLPMRLRGRRLGALNLFRSEAGGLDESDVLAAQALADVATIALIQHQVFSDARVMSAQLDQTLQDRVVIEQAKGRISEAAAIDVDRAFRRLRNHARNHNMRLVEVCMSLIDGTMRPGRLDALPEPRR